MAVSKRLRFEILRRDNHACRYCGRLAPEFKLTVDHVVPITLGGTDEPSNLVAACIDCNAGKSSVSVDGPVVEDVAEDALRWAAAMELVAQGRAAERAEAVAKYDHFLQKWNSWTCPHLGARRTINLPTDWRTSVDRFLKAGLYMDDLHELVDVAMGAKTKDVWRYFCGCCWQRIKQNQEQAKAIVKLWDDQDTSATRDAFAHLFAQSGRDN